MNHINVVISEKYPGVAKDPHPMGIRPILPKRAD